MASSSKRKQTMAKVARERAKQEKREAKAQKKEERKRAKELGLEPGEELELGDELPTEESPVVDGSE